MHALELTFGREGIEWRVVGGKVPPLPASAWPGAVVRDLEAFASWHALSDAWIQGWIDELEPGRFLLDYRRFYEVDADLRSELGLVEARGLGVEVQSQGSVADGSFRIDVEVRSESGDRFADLYQKCVGPLYVKSDKNAVCLPEGVSQLIQVSREVPQANAGPSERLRYLASVKAQAIRCGARLDQYLAQEDVTLGEKVGFEVAAGSASEIEIHPVVHDGSGHEIPVAASRGSSPKTLVRKDGDRRSRVVLTPESRDDVEEILARQNIHDANVPRFLTNPEAFLPDRVDLKQYGDRVKAVDVTIYNSRPYLHVKRNAGGWLEGAMEIEAEPSRGDDGPVGAQPTPLEASPTLSPETYKRLATQATDDGWVRDGDNWVQIDRHDREFVGRAEAAGFDLSQPGYQRMDGVLQIFANLELLEYVVAEEKIRKELAGREWQFDDTPLPKSFSGTLLSHQLRGYQWLSGLYGARLGGLLADEMGLGKTVQILAHFARLHELGKLRPALLVVPLSLMENWERELRRFIHAQIVLHRHEGSKASRMRGLHLNPDVVLVSYDTLRRDQLELARHDWTVVVCDEAQYVKNPTAQRTSVVKALKADQCLALTGTPVENGLIEFWCIMDFVQPGRLGSWSDFRERFERPIIDSTEEDERRKLVDGLQVELQPHYLRRHKDEVLKELPIKHSPEHRLVPLGPGQLDEYRDTVVEAKAGGRGAALGAIQRLLQVCARPPRSLLSQPASAQLEACPKLAETLDILAAIRGSGEKAVVFTRFLELQAMLQRVISETFGLFPDCINGSLAGNRQRVIDVFSEKNGFNVVILSHDVAGVGLNVTAANHVIHYTRPWNPAKENQATDRVHRIGQAKPVHVYLPMAVDDRFVTVEQRLDELLAAKAVLARDVLVPMRDWAVTNEDLLDCVEDAEIPG